MADEFQRDLIADGISPDEVKRKASRSRKKIISAPVVVVLCVDMSEMDDYPDTKRKKAEYVIATQSAANAGMQLLLAAHAEGLGGVWVCSPMFAQEAVKNSLGLPDVWEPQAMFLLGYPVEEPALRERKNIKDISIFK